MTTRFTRPVSFLAVVAVSALLGGIAAAAGISTPQFAVNAEAASHCTRFAPTVSQDVGCTTSSTMNVGTYYTPSVAYRDNARFFAYASRSWTLAYVGTAVIAQGTGTTGAIGAYAASRVQVTCSMSGGQTVGHCRTDWHD